MKRERILREKDIEVLRRHAVRLDQEVEALYRKLAQVRAELARAEGKSQVELEFVVRHLTEQLASRNAEQFSTSQSERRGRSKDAQGAEGGSDQGEDRENKNKKEKNQTGHGPTPQPNLEVKVRKHELPENERQCPHCDRQLRERPEMAVKSEQISVEIRTYHILEHQQVVYGCDRCGHLDMAPKPDSFIQGGRYTEDFAAQVVVDKYADHLPLERQVERMKRAGLTVTSQTLWDQEARLLDLLMPTGEAHHAWMLSTHGVLGADETWWRMMGKGRSEKWWAWSLSAPDGIYFDLLPTRGRAAAQIVLEDFHGVVVADGYSVYASLEHEVSQVGGVQLPLTGAEVPRKLSDFLLACCWAHARRYFVKAERNYANASVVLDMIAELYAVEADATHRALAGEDILTVRRELRGSRSRPIVEKIHGWLLAQHPPPKLQLDEAVQYSLNRWSALTVFLDHPEVPIDNSSTEQGIRGPVLGRLNFQGVRSVTGARAAALFYSLIGTCKRQGIDPFAYLVYAARRAMEKPKTVTLPHEYKAHLAKMNAAADQPGR